MYKVVAIGDRDFCTGFALAGIETQQVSPDTAWETVTQAQASGQYGIIVMDEGLCDTLNQQKPLNPSAASIPVIVPVPAEMRWKDVEKLEEDSYVAAMIRQAIGYQLDINL